MQKEYKNSMGNESQKCPVCGKPLSQDEYDKALGIWKEKHEEIKHLEKERADLKAKEVVLKKQKAEAHRAAKAMVVEQKKKFRLELRQKQTELKESFNKKLEAQTAKGIAKGITQQNREFKKKESEFNKAKNKMGQLEHSLKIALKQKDKGDQEIKHLREQMEKGITPQIEGLLEEHNLLSKLKELFPHDQFEHPGKGGDIVQIVIEQGKIVGKIVYECKKVKTFSQGHIQQAADAREQRQANFAVLVTNAFPAKRQSYFVANTVFVISPVNVEAVTYVLRQSLVRISLKNLSTAEKMKAVNEVYRYLSGNEYSDKINGMSYQLTMLAGDLRTEMQTHRQTWKKRYETYKDLFIDVNTIDTRLKSLLSLGEGKEAQPVALENHPNYPLLEELEKK